MTSTDTTARPGFGRALASRSRPRLGMSHRLGRATSVGVVARATTGFGRTIGRAGSARPRIEYQRARSAQPAVRPPFGSWTTDDTTRLDEAAWSRADRSPAGPESAPPAPAGDVVSLGDPKVDALRRLLKRGPGRDAERSQAATARPAPASTPAPGRSAGPTRSAAPTPDPAAPIGKRRPAVPRVRGATLAGPATGPGQLGRRLRPETVPAPAAAAAGIPASAPIPGPVPTGSGTTRPGPAGGAGTGTGRTRSTARRSPTDDVAALMRTVAARHTATPARPTSPPRTGDDVRRDPADGARPGPVGDHDDPPGHGRIDRQRLDAVRRTTPRSAPASPAPTSPGPTPPGPASPGPARGAGVDDTARATVADGAVALPRAIDPAGGPIATSVSTASGTIVRTTRPGTTELRRVRMLSAGIEPHDGGLERVTPRPPVALVGEPQPSETAPEATPDATRDATPDVAGVAPRHRAVERRPASPTIRRAMARRAVAREAPMVDLAERVSLPHSRSRDHRPVTELTRALVARRESRGPTSRPALQPAEPTTSSLVAPAREPRSALRLAPDSETTDPRDGPRPSDTGTAPRRLPRAIRSDGAATERPASDVPPHDAGVRPLLRIVGAPPATTSTTTPAASPDLRREPATTREPGHPTLRPATTREPGHPTLRPSTTREPGGPTLRPSLTRPTLPPATAGDRDRATRTPATARDRHDPRPPDLVRPGSLFAHDRLAAPAAARRSPVAPGPGVLQRAIAGAETSADAPPTGTPPPAPPTPTPSTAASPTAPGRREWAATALPAARPDAVAERFLSELSQGTRRRPAPLPTAFTPMAEAITGRRTVMISTDDASRRALKAVGKVAATTDDVIHLARAPRPDPRTAEVVAHELTHVAHPSPAPRFFDDDQRGPEERRAEQVGRIMARAPLAPTAPVSRRSDHGGPAAGHGAPAHQPTRPGERGGNAPTGARTIRRSPASSGGTVSAAALAAELSGAAPSISRRAAPAVQRRREPDVDRRSPPTLTGDGHEGATTGDSDVPTHVESYLESGEGRDWFRQQLQDHIDLIVRALEDHVIVELERRGGRGWGGL